MRSTFFTGLAALSLLAFSACDSTSDSGGVTIEAQTVTNVAADPNTGLDATTGRPTGARGRYTLYSLRENKVIANSDSATNKWDIGFQSSTIIANTGAKGPGQGGILLRVGAFQDLTVAPDTTYGASVSGTQWYDYNTATNIISPKAGRTFVLRTGDGKQYAKLRLLSYYKNQVASTDPTASRYYSFEYVLQTDGSRTFD